MNKVVAYLAIGITAGAIGFYYLIHSPAQIRRVTDDVVKTGQVIDYNYRGQKFKAHSKSFDGPSKLEIVVFNSMGQSHVAVRDAGSDIIDKAPILKLYADGEIDEVLGVNLGLQKIRSAFQLFYQETINLADNTIDLEEAERSMQRIIERNKESEKRLQELQKQLGEIPVK